MTLRIVHLAFEDHRRPGSGGGGARTHEVNRRLARRHRVTVVTARYRGARRRVEDGVAYRPLGIGVLGYHVSIVSYHLAVPLYVLLSPTVRRADVVVEDFAVPVSSDLVPLWTRRPTVAVVQWLFARERAAQYHLPLQLPEAWGLRLHRRFVAVSGYIAERISAANPSADVHVVYAGTGAPAEPPDVGRVPGRVLYLGRLDWGPKGLDHLVEAFAALAAAPGAHRRDCHLVVAGDGPDEGRLREALAAAGLAERATLVGRVGGDAKWRLLASAEVVVIPSRYETFGLVAAEANAVGTPVVGFEIPSLQEIVVGGGVLVPPGDTGAMADAVRRVLVDPDHRRAMAAAARRQAARFDWDEAAAAQEAVYLAAAGRPTAPAGATGGSPAGGSPAGGSPAGGSPVEAGRATGDRADRAAGVAR